MFPYALTIFVGAFLLFQVQPLIAKHILPWFGGGPAVWTTAMLFFQVFLLGGYAYAHLSVRKLTPRVQVGVHLALLALALTQLPITPAEAWKPTGVELPTWRILLLLTSSIGLPYFVLSSTTPLMQAWLSQARPGRSPYRLYALSNLAALLALLSYPFVVEPALTRSTQTLTWSAAFGFFVVVCGASAVWTAWARPEDVGEAGARAPDPTGPPPTIGARVLWVALSACASVLFLAVTNQITRDVAVIPFLWVLPLSLYLLTFVIAFDHDRWYLRGWFAAAFVPATMLAVWFMFRGQVAPVGQQLFVYSAVLFIGCMICHGELTRRRPHPRHLTGFYLTIALGGVLGGIFVALIAPLIFNDYLELHLALMGVAGLALFALFEDEESPLYRGQPSWAWVTLILAVLVLGSSLTRQATTAARLTVERSRSFYGVISLYREGTGTPAERLWLSHGRVRHGVQYVAPGRRRWGTGYYASDTGAALALESLPGENRRIGMVGMGVGTLATYAKSGDYIRVYEINPDVRRLAETRFTYLSESPAEIDVVMGDARLSMEREPPQAFDMLILDAFSGDAIPLHLLTREAFEIYQRHLGPDGVMALLIDTWHLDFGPVVRGLADYFGFHALRIGTGGGPQENWGSDWMLLTRNEAFFDAPAFARYSRVPLGRGGYGRLWTDGYTSLFQVLN
jgi:hypothetical protein